MKEKEQGQKASGSTRRKKSEAPPLPSQEDIARRAHEISVARGGEPGHELDDWLQAERELSAGSQ